MFLKLFHWIARQMHPVIVQFSSCLACHFSKYFWRNDNRLIIYSLVCLGEFRQEVEAI